MVAEVAKEMAVSGHIIRITSGGSVHTEEREKIRKAILQYLATNEGSHSPQDVLEYVLKQLDCNELDLAKAILVDTISRGELDLTPEWKLAAAG